MIAARRIGLIARRELAAERREPDGAVAALSFLAVLILIESLVVGPATAREPAVAAALFWIAMAFALMFATTRSFDRELQDDAIEAVLALPGGRDALYGGKVAALALGAVAIAWVGGALALVLLDLAVALPGHLVLAVAAGSLALPPVVVLDVMLALRLRARGLVVPILALPVLVPQLVAATQAAATALGGDGPAALGWCGLLVAFGLAYGVLGFALGPTALD